MDRDLVGTNVLVIPNRRMNCIVPMTTKVRQVPSSDLGSPFSSRPTVIYEIRIRDKVPKSRDANFALPDSITRWVPFSRVGDRDWGHQEFAARTGTGESDRGVVATLCYHAGELSREST